MDNIYRLAELNARHREQQRKLFNIESLNDILAELYNQGKQITLCKVPAHMGI